MIDRAALLADLKKQVTAVEADLNQQLRALPEVKARLHDEWAHARKLNRTAATETSWLDERITQVAVAWVLGTVFVRFCEDNRLIPEPYLTGPTDDRRELAQARYDAYVESDADPTYRGWLEQSFAELGAGQAGKLLFDRAHNALYQIPVSHDGARDLIEFWRTRDEHGTLVHNFTDPLDEDGINGWDTRFLGDLYQDLSEDIRKKYALLQTPEFVEEFILDRTLEPAIGEFGYAEIKLIDPTCGSGHFVLGAFKRLNERWAKNQPTKDRHERVQAALNSVHGVDLNPFAIAIARFRLLVAAMAAADVRNLAEASRYDWPIKLAVGDSLIKARQLELSFDGDIGDPLAEFSYATEDVQDYPGILEQGNYHVVVGNPPYITVKDENLNKIYRGLYKACAGTYALSVPFAQRFFELAKIGNPDGYGFGRVGQITSNSFMKREFGTKLIEEFFAHSVELTEVIDTSGAYIPGHGTPTVILVGTRKSGKSRRPRLLTVRSVQGEPRAPENPEQGLVWQAIVKQVAGPGASVSQWVSVDDLDRDRFANQPWILADGGHEMVEQLNAAANTKLSAIIDAVGRTTHTGLDDAYYIPPSAAKSHGISSSCVPVVLGDAVRDFTIEPSTATYFPYDDTGKHRTISVSEARFLWPNRTVLRQRVDFGQTPEQRGLRWFDHSMFFPKRYRSPLSISFAEVATHNHFVLDRGGKVFKQTAPVIKLPEGSSEEKHLQLLGLLNSSTACFWLKMSCYPKGGDPMGDDGARVSAEPWSDRYQFNSKNVGRFPVPTRLPTSIIEKLDMLANQISSASPTAMCHRGVPTGQALRDSEMNWHKIRAQMIAMQEELDWTIYSVFNLTSEDFISPPNEVPEIQPGERAFEIVLARRAARGESSDEWFKRHKSTPTLAIPAHWPEPYRQVVQRRMMAIESSRAIGMIERPDYKRRWATDGWEALQERALRSWLLDQMSSRRLWFDNSDQPQMLTLTRLADRLAEDVDFVSVAALYAPRTNLAKVVGELISDHHIPFISALRYKPSGLKKRQSWDHVWDMQRQEDAMPDGPAKNDYRKTIPVPPKYTSADFLRTPFWQARGKLDVPKERFISYGSTNAATPDLFGWAGWDHREQAMAIAIYLADHSLSTEEITPFLAGLLELQPWLDQWHNEIDPNFGIAPSTFLAGDRHDRQSEHGLTDDDLRNWRPQPATRGRRAPAKRTTKKTEAAQGDN
ncbi:DNA methylase [Nocardia sp. Root136]|uniref:BREX-2 system adenine-specific DNA-methyltransferase PglX n=1 Tax=Nocardia sp. Root136 TaxID=1736458 RepID=UPI000701BFFF|nr:BREX-2 system adenine-specific DNA-methyltransferase PglX [Nocardia sp. Root136]KQY36815.1 DNA methylase [Nocardia sp. Root136]